MRAPGISDSPIPICSLNQCEPEYLHLLFNWMYILELFIKNLHFFERTDEFIMFFFFGWLCQPANTVHPLSRGECLVSSRKRGLYNWKTENVGTVFAATISTSWYPFIILNVPILVHLLYSRQTDLFWTDLSESSFSNSAENCHSVRT